MCLINEVPAKGQTVVGWKVFAKSPRVKGAFEGVFWSSCDETYHKEVTYTAVNTCGINYHRSQAKSVSYKGFHGFFTRDAARKYRQGLWDDYKRGPFTVRRCVFFGVIATGEIVGDPPNIPSLRAEKMIIL